MYQVPISLYVYREIVIYQLAGGYIGGLRSQHYNVRNKYFIDNLWNDFHKFSVPKYIRIV